jgi:hypothetical protein
MLLWLGAALICASALSHEIEHLAWGHDHGCRAHEAASGPASLDQDQPAAGMHHHGCAAHEHGPAILETTGFIPALSCAALEAPGNTSSPSQPHRKIEHPPRPA